MGGGQRHSLVDPSEVPQVPIHQTSTGLRLANVDKIFLERVVEVIGVNRLTLQQAALDPANLATALLVDEQPRAELVGLDFEEPGELLEVHGGV